MKFIFFGTPEFAAIILEKLIAADYVPVAVVCNPNEPVGRKQILTPPLVKRLIEKHLPAGRQEGPIEIFQPATKLDLLALCPKLSAIAPDFMVIAAYGKIIPKEILDIPYRGTLNIHPSLLPKYRGTSPIQYAILKGDKETGVTIMGVDEEMDHGPILANSILPIANSDTYEILSQKLAISGAELLIKTIPYFISGNIKPIEQDHSKATYTKIIKKEDGEIYWLKNADEIERMTRAYYPWPTSWTTWNNRILKIIETKPLESSEKDFTDSAIADFVKWPIGRVFLYNSIIAVKCGQGALIIKKLQLEGGKVLTAKEFLNGHKNFVGSVLKQKKTRAKWLAQATTDATPERLTL